MQITNAILAYPLQKHQFVSVMPFSRQPLCRFDVPRNELLVANGACVLERQSWCQGNTVTDLGCRNNGRSNPPFRSEGAAAGEGRHPSPQYNTQRDIPLVVKGINRSIIYLSCCVAVRFARRWCVRRGAELNGGGPGHTRGPHGP